MIRYSIDRISNRRISNQGSNRQIFDRSNIEYRISNRGSNSEIFDPIEYRIIESVRCSNILPRFDDSIFDHRIWNISNHRIFEYSVSLGQSGQHVTVDEQ